MTGQSASEIADEAAAWVARLDAGDWSSEDEARLDQWLAADPRRRGALLHAQACWVALDRPAAPGRAAVPRRGLIMAAGGALAASVAGGFLWLARGTTYRTELGEIRRVPLADGSTATINSDTRLEVILASRRREVRIASGEAWFRVAKDPARPFVVEAGQVVVQAVGTAFSVRRRDGGADIVVTEGVVQVWAAQADGYRTSLVAGQSAFFGDNAAVRISDASPSAVDRALAWRSGAIDLSGQTVAHAVDDFNRYNRRKLVLADPRLAGEQIDGIFRTDDPEGFAKALHDSFGVALDTSDADAIRIGHAKNISDVEGSSSPTSLHQHGKATRP
ncbi:FecR domain-containing protein [Sphingomonas sp. RHCKR7]|uniref:FecR family protein n=1 Tax=Sphingomonas folli TaxID=2862497 RepID=UPI001CA47621|nr:FecR domain-containing protein [Sphingomonas folli]MBW6525682.1 FecR domain-containing protein [Sphingomonas folli]